MKNIAILGILVLSIPQIASAVWYNPFSWFKKKPVVSAPKVVQVEQPVTSPITAEKKEESTKKPVVQKQVPKKETPIIVNVNLISQTPISSVEQEVTLETEAQVEARLEKEKQDRIKKAIVAIKNQNTAEILVLKQEISKVKDYYGKQIEQWKNAIGVSYDEKMYNVNKLELELSKKVKDLEDIIEQKNNKTELDVLQFEAQLNS